MRTRVKICGITRVEDALAATAAGADAIGLIFAEASPRCVSADQARAIVAALPPFVTVVGLFVDAPAARIREVLGQVPLDLLQFHGRETPEDCRKFGRPYIKTIHIREDVDVAGTARRYPDAAGILFDAFHPQLAGGSGTRFDWTRVPRDLDRPVILAGGLTPENVAEAVRTVRPYAVDVSSGVESSKGIKDAASIAAFIRNAAAGSVSRF
jgi:phosphoribosylanthranilate isomerase